MWLMLASIDPLTVTTTRMTQGMLTESAERDHLLGSYPFRGLGIPDDVAQAALFLSSEDAGWVSGVSCTITYSGVVLTVDRPVFQ